MMLVTMIVMVMMVAVDVITVPAMMVLVSDGMALAAL